MRLFELYPARAPRVVHSDLLSAFAPFARSTDLAFDAADLDCLFDSPSQWRAQAAQSLGLSGEALLAG